MYDFGIMGMGRGREKEKILRTYRSYDFWAVAHFSASFSFHVCSFTLLAFIFFFIMTDTLRSEGRRPRTIAVRTYVFPRSKYAGDDS